MDSESTMKFYVNLDRPAIEVKLKQLTVLCDMPELAEVGRLIGSLDGKPRAELEHAINQAIGLLGGNDEYGYIIDQLDMLLMNLPNIQ